MSLVKRYFDSVAPSYAQRYTEVDHGYPTIKLRSEQSLEWFHRRLKPKDSSILDIGCGTGWMLELLAKSGYRAHGIDISTGMVEAARQRLARAGKAGTRATVAVADLSHWKSDRLHDGALALGVFEYLHEDSGLMKTASASLRPGGHFVVECRNRLFNLTSMNEYSAEVARSREYSQLFREYEELMTHPALANFPETTGVLARELTRAFRPWKGERNSRKLVVTAKTARTYEKIVRRQHTPLTLAAVARRHGMELTAVRFLHCHPLPPRFEEQSPLFFRRLGLALESISKTPAAAVMCSSFMACFTKQDRPHRRKHRHG